MTVGHFCIWHEADLEGSQQFVRFGTDCVAKLIDGAGWLALGYQSGELCLLCRRLRGDRRQAP